MDNKDNSGNRTVDGTFSESYEEDRGDSEELATKLAKRVELLKKDSIVNH